ncbi:MAG: DUF3309 domain-containing protein [Candidatus Moeniiplasma glomeromycotorum]|nr:DUF3309 domain-containing protein [Candidatus Moeniiplasma glomeromycotorum]MCE8169940.1 DUF3309 domain-containing protein [Candidatus Moeniiplasma glomeromycotorum]
MADSKTIHIKKTSDDFLKDVPVKGGKDDEKYDIKIDESEQDANFDKIDNDKSSKNTIKIKVKKHGKDKSDWETAEAKIKCKSGFFRTRFYLEPKIKIGTTEVELSSEKLANTRLSTDKHSYGWGFYGVIGVALIIVIGGIWWWIASSKSEDEDKGDI